MKLMKFASFYFDKDKLTPKIYLCEARNYTSAFWEAERNFGDQYLHLKTIKISSEQYQNYLKGE